MSKKCFKNVKKVQGDNKELKYIKKSYVGQNRRKWHCVIFEWFLRSHSNITRYLESKTSKKVSHEKKVT